ncbi:MAG: hypothetical protein ABSE99_00460 [Terracidiphilus sp.]|jgi:hypothetical protein
MNPCPAGLEIHPDLAGYRAFPLQKSETDAASLNSSDGRITLRDA